jgi:hypothetical protein
MPRPKRPMKRADSLLPFGRLAYSHSFDHRRFIPLKGKQLSRVLSEQPAKPHCWPSACGATDVRLVD